MTNLTVRPDAGPSRCSQPAPRITTAKTPALPAAASSASTLGCSRKGAVSRYGRAGGTTAGRSDRDHRDPRPRDREGSPRPGRPQAGRSRQRDRDIRDRRLAMTAPIDPAVPAVMISIVDHVAAWAGDANHPAHTSAPVTGICKNRAPKCQIVDHAGLAVSPEDPSWTTRRDLRRGGYRAHEPLLHRVSMVVVP